MLAAVLELGNLGCKTGSSCNVSGPPTEDRSQFGMWAIVSAPLVLSVDLTNRCDHKPLCNRVLLRWDLFLHGGVGSSAMLDRIWVSSSRLLSAIVSNTFLFPFLNSALDRSPSSPTPRPSP